MTRNSVKNDVIHTYNGAICDALFKGAFNILDQQKEYIINQQKQLTGTGIFFYNGEIFPYGFTSTTSTVKPLHPTLISEYKQILKNQEQYINERTEIFNYIYSVAQKSTHDNALNNLYAHLPKECHNTLIKLGFRVNQEQLELVQHEKLDRIKQIIQEKLIFNLVGDI